MLPSWRRWLCLAALQLGCRSRRCPLPLPCTQVCSPSHSTAAAVVSSLGWCCTQPQFIAHAHAVSSSRACSSARRGQPLAAGQTFVGAVTADKEMRFGVVVARFNSLVTKQLLEGAHETFERHGVSSANVDVGACACYTHHAQHAAAESCSCSTTPETFFAARFRLHGCPAALSCQWLPRVWPSLGPTMPSFASAQW